MEQCANHTTQQESRPDDWNGNERRSTCMVHLDTVQEIYNKLVSWKVFVLVVGLAAAGVSGTNLLVQSSVKDTRVEISTAFIEMKAGMEASNAILHRRISEGNDQRVDAIDKLTVTINRMNEKLGILDWRMNAVEDQLRSKGFTSSGNGKKTP